MSKLISIGKIIDITWSHYVKHFKTLMRITLWLFLLTLIAIITAIVVPGDLNATIDLPNGSISTITIILLQLVATVTGVIVGTWIFLTIVQVIFWQHKKKQGTIKNASKKSWKLFLSYIWIAFLKGLAGTVPVLLILPGIALILYNTMGPLIPWLSGIGILLTFLGLIAALSIIIWVSVVFNFAGYKLVFEDKRGIQALKDSKQLVEGRFWATFLRIVLPKLVFIIPLIFLQIVLVIFFALLTPSIVGSDATIFVRISEIVDNLISTGIAVLSTPLFVIADYYVYDSLKKTK